MYAAIVPSEFGPAFTFATSVVFPMALKLTAAPEIFAPLLSKRAQSKTVAVESVTAVGNRDELVRDALPRKFLFHHHRLFVRHVGVFVAVNQKGRRIFLRDVAYRTKRIKPPRLRVGIVSADDLGPKVEGSADSDS